eukprot:COSAG03_NODE_917_length_5334_cov_28.906399_3_plen_92_part_00
MQQEQLRELKLLQQTQMAQMQHFFATYELPSAVGRVSLAVHDASSVMHGRVSVRMVFFVQQQSRSDLDLVGDDRQALLQAHYPLAASVPGS